VKMLSLMLLQDFAVHSGK